jgi:hypothetical protein
LVVQRHKQIPSGGLHMENSKTLKENKGGKTGQIIRIEQEQLTPSSLLKEVSYETFFSAPLKLYRLHS